MASLVSKGARLFCRHCHLPKPSWAEGSTVADPRLREQTIATLKEIDQEPSETKRKALTTKTGVANSFRSDLHRDEVLALDLNSPAHTPGDVLHIFQLGVIKALVRLGYALCTKSKRCRRSTQRLAAWIDSTNFNGAGHRVSGGSMRHCGSWVGRDFQAVVDLLPLLFRQVGI